MGRTLTVRPLAKINLTLHVGPRRADGFHDVRTLLQSVALSDTLTFAARRGPLSLLSRGLGVPDDRTNLVWRAADALWRALGRAGDPMDVHIRVEKQIPVAAGLGGGSADAAATLLGLNTMWDARLSIGDLMRLGAGLGSDVPFFLQGGTALGVNRGEELYPVDDVARRGIVLVKPNFGVRTGDAYQWLDDDRTAGAAGIPGVGEERGVDLGWPTGPVALRNDLQAPVARRHPVIAEIIAACLHAGALGAAMTGSGSAVFGIFPETVARTAVQRLRRPDRLVILTRTATRREAVRHGRV